MKIRINAIIFRASVNIALFFSFIVLQFSLASMENLAVAGNYDPNQLMACHKVCSQQRQKDEQYCKSKLANDAEKMKICIQSARNDEDRCDASCERKFGR